MILTGRLEKTEGELAVSSNACKLLSERCDILEERASLNERTTTNNGQYLRNKQVEVKLLPTGIADLPVPQLKKAMSELLSLTDVDVGVNDIGKCHKLGGDGKSVIMELHSREKRDEMLLSRKKLKNKTEEMESMNMRGVMIIESMCREYSKLDFICRSLKRNGDIHETWFFNGRLHMKIVPNGRRLQISHIDDLYEQFGRSNINSLLRPPRRSGDSY